jgi:hypothetical protein
LRHRGRNEERTDVDRLDVKDFEGLDGTLS